MKSIVYGPGHLTVTTGPAELRVSSRFQTRNVLVLSTLRPSITKYVGSPGLRQSYRKMYKLHMCRIMARIYFHPSAKAFQTMSTLTSQVCELIYEDLTQG